MIRRKRKRNPLKDDKKLMRKVAEFLAKAIEKQPDGITAYLLAAELVRRDTLYCEECHSFDIEKGCDWSECYPEIYDLEEDSTLEMAKEAAEELAEDLGIVDYIKVFRYEVQIKKYKNSNWDNKFIPCIELSGMNLSRKDLSVMDLSLADLSEADLSKSNLEKANLERANLSKANLEEANLERANLEEANLERANLEEANLSEANLYGSDLFRANLPETNLSEADLSHADLSRANLSRANLSEANLNWSNLYKTIFTDSKITKTTMILNAKYIDDAIDLKISNPRKKIIYDKTKKKSNKTKSSKRNIKRSR